jgi:hypothetical protein
MPGTIRPQILNTCPQLPLRAFCAEKEDGFQFIELFSN